MSQVPNKQYSLVMSDSLESRLVDYQRGQMFAKFMDELAPDREDTILDIGATSESTYKSSNHVEKWYPYKEKITAAGIDDASFLEEEYPGLRFVEADGRDLPFEDQSFDFVHSSAVIEHVGSRTEQAQFISECARVARKGFFITTPNRWFPVEFHTIMPLLHWLPPVTFRAIMRRTGREFFSHEANLNLLSKSGLLAAARSVGSTERFDLGIQNVRLAGWPSNLLLIGVDRSRSSVSVDRRAA